MAGLPPLPLPPGAKQAQVGPVSPGPSVHVPGTPVNIGLPSPVSGVTDFLARLTEQATWIRVAEVMLGLILIAVGVAKITRVVPIATQVAKTAGALA